MSFSVDIAEGFRIDLRKLDISELEVDKDALIRGDLKVYGTVTEYVDEILYGKATIIPSSAGADALVIRDATDTVDRVKLVEDGKLWFGADVNLRRSAANELSTDDTFCAKEVFSRVGGFPRAALRYTGRVETAPPPASATDTLKDSPEVALIGRYYDGTSSVVREAEIFHRMLTTTPTSELAFQIASIDILRAQDDGDLIPSGDLIIGNILLPEDAGPVTFADLPVSSIPAAGSEMSYVFAIDAESILTIYAEADGLGGIQNKAVKIWTPLSVTGDIKLQGDFDFCPASSGQGEIGTTTLKWGSLRVSDVMVTRRDSGDYGGNFSTYTPPAGEEGRILVAEDTNATSLGRRLYVYSGGAWRYVDLT